MKRITLILILTFLSLCNTTFSQTKTTYEKKVDQIMIEMCKAVGVDNSLLQMAIKLNDWDIVRTSQDFSFKCKMLDRNELLVIVLSTDQKLKDAKKLKTDIDFRKEKEKEEKERLRKEQELHKELIRYSDLENIKNDIKEVFTKWIKKDEFETLSEHKARTSNKEKVIDSISYEAIIKRITTLKCEYYSDRYFIELKNYNSDNQQYSISLAYKVSLGSTYVNKNMTVNDTLLVNINLAKRIKEKAEQGSISWDGNDGQIIKFCKTKIIFSKELNNWALSSNGFFFPISYTILGEYTHKSKIYQSSVDKLTIKTDELGLQEYFNVNHTINIDAFLNEKLENRRNYLINQADKFVAEYKMERAILSLKDANEIRQSDDINSKINEIQLKIIEEKVKELIKSAELYEKDESIQYSIEKLLKIKEFYIEANNLKYNNLINTKIIEVEGKLIDLKQDELIKSAEQSIKSGKISLSVEKLKDANNLKLRADLSDKIELLIRERDLAITNHKIVDSLFILSQSEKLKLFNNLVIPSTLDDIKKGYGQKYVDCKSSITSRIDSLWKVLSDTKAENELVRNNEVWDDKSQELIKKSKEFRNELNKYLNFEINVQEALFVNDKKYLKIFKEENITLIIETIINSKVN